ncbi:MAG: T9SS type A sorting domain-containing protein [Bacteroidales bacterium]|nr:T9SS type A sorting domain-containing protein [Bacteroidales bacterium]
MKRIYHCRKLIIFLCLFFGLNATAQTFEVTFNLDMSAASGFNPASDIVYLTGTMFGWAMPGTQPENQTMSRVGSSMIWIKTVSVSAGMNEYKYFLNNGWSGGEWPGDPNRIFEVYQNTTLNDTWSVYGSEYAVTFNVDMSNAVNFNPDSDIVYVTGSMTGWSEPGTELEIQTMSRVGSSMIWSKTMNILQGMIHYKYFINAGWDGAEWLSGTDRQYNITGETVLDDTWGVLENMHTITFNVDMTLALDFNPLEDTVFLTGSMFGWAEPGTQLENQMMTRVGNTMVWTKSMMLIAGFYEYKYFLNFGWLGGEWMGAPNRIFMVNQEMTIENYFGLFDNFYTITFNVDMTSATGFNPSNDFVYMTGSMFDWAEPGLYPDDQALIRVGNSMIWSRTYEYVIGGNYQYKYFINSGWSGTEFPDGPSHRDLYLYTDLVLNDAWGIITSEFTNPDRGSILLYPNPFTDRIIADNLHDFNKLTIFDITGRIMFERNLTNTREIFSNLNLPNRIYVLHFTNDHGVYKTFKMIRN